MHFTQNPIGSDDQLDLQDNAISFDYAMNSPTALWQDRFGKQHKTVQQALKDVGFKPAGFDFVSGGTLGIGDRDKCVFYPTDGYWYSWNGKLPYVVPVNSSPTPGGRKGWGVVTRDESVIAREALRRTYLEAGYNLVEGSFEQGGVLNNQNDVLLQERTGKAFSGPAGVVAAGTDPTNGGFVDKSLAIIIPVTYAGIRSYSDSSLMLRCVGRQTVFDHGFGYFWRDDSDATSPDNDGTVLIDALGRRWKRIFIGAADVRWWGAVGDGVNDDTIAIQNAIAAASPFKWNGSVSATKQAMFNKPAATIIFPSGVFRVTAPIALNPYIVIKGSGCGNFFNSRGNSCILGDFAGKDKFILDAAPYNASGVREFSAYGNAARFDSGQIVGVPGIILEDFGIESANGTHRGALNLHAASITKVNRVSMTRACTGVQVSACWSGSVRDCFILARAVGAVFDHMTVFNFDTNYLSVTGERPTSSEYQYPLYNPEIPADSITGVAILGGYMQMQNNTIEGQEIGIHLRQVSGATVRSQYFEKISKYAFSVADCKAYLEIARLDCPSAKIIKYRGTWSSDVCLDFHAHRENQQLSYNLIGEITNGKIQIKGLSTFLKGGLELLPYIQQEPLLNTNGQLELFVNSASGNDSNNGQSPELPVKTLNALLPMVKAFINYPIVINIAGVVDSFVESDNQARYPFLKNANITLQGNGTLHFTKNSTNLHSLSMTDSKLFVRNLTVTAVDETLAGGYRALFQANGVCSVTLENVTIPAKQPIFGSSTNSSTNLSISMYRCNISTTSASIFMETDETYSGTVVWTEAGHGNSTTNRTVGGRPSDIKIGSATFR